MEAPLDEPPQTRRPLGAGGASHPRPPRVASAPGGKAACLLAPLLQEGPAGKPAPAPASVAAPSCPWRAGGDQRHPRRVPGGPLRLRSRRVRPAVTAVGERAPCCPGGRGTGPLPPLLVDLDLGPRNATSQYEHYPGTAAPAAAAAAAAAVATAAARVPVGPAAAGSGWANAVALEGPPPLTAVASGGSQPLQQQHPGPRGRSRIHPASRWYNPRRRQGRVPPGGPSALGAVAWPCGRAGDPDFVKASGAPCRPPAGTREGMRRRLRRTPARAGSFARRASQPAAPPSVPIGFATHWADAAMGDEEEETLGDAADLEEGLRM